MTDKEFKYTFIATLKKSIAALRAPKIKNAEDIKEIDPRFDPRIKNIAEVNFHN